MSFGFDITICDKSYYIQLTEPQPQTSQELTALVLLEKMEVVFDRCLQYDVSKARPSDDPLQDPLEFLKAKALSLQPSGILSWLRRATYRTTCLEVHIERTCNRILVRPHFSLLPSKPVALVFDHLNTEDSLSLSSVNKTMRSFFTSYLSEKFSLDWIEFRNVKKAHPSRDIKVFLQELHNMSFEERILLLKREDLEAGLKFAPCVNRSLLKQLPHPVPKEMQTRAIELLSDILISGANYKDARAIIITLFRLGWDIDTRCGEKLLLEIYFNHFNDKDIQTIIDIKPDILSFKEFNLLHLTVIHTLYSINGFIMKLGIDLNSVDAFKRTALHYAVDFNDLAWISALIKSGANPNLVDADGRTPLRIVCQHSNRNLLPLIMSLVENGALISEEDIEHVKQRNANEAVTYLKEKLRLQLNDQTIKGLQNKVESLEAQVMLLQHTLANLKLDG